MSTRIVRLDAKILQSWRLIDVLAEALKGYPEFDPDQPRGEGGKWEESGGGDGGGESESTGQDREARSTAVNSFLAREKNDIKPTHTSKKEIALWKRDNFPRLNTETANVVGETDGRVLVGYNCIGNAADDNKRWWFPFKSGDTEQLRNEFFWPSVAKRNADVQSFDDLFVRIGKGSITKNDEFETGYVKLALFTLRGKPVHMARQVSTGQWLSKMGPMQKLLHNLHDLDRNRVSYGNVTRIYRVPVEEFVKFKDMK